MRLSLLMGAALLTLAGCGDGRHDLERKYDRLKLGTTAEQVTAVMGEGRPVTAADIAAYPEHPKLDVTGLPDDTR